MTTGYFTHRNMVTFFTVMVTQGTPVENVRSVLRNALSAQSPAEGLPESTEQQRDIPWWGTPGYKMWTWLKEPYPPNGSDRGGWKLRRMIGWDGSGVMRLSRRHPS